MDKLMTFLQFTWQCVKDAFTPLLPTKEDDMEINCQICRKPFDPSAATCPDCLAVLAALAQLPKETLEKLIQQLELAHALQVAETTPQLVE
jgi:predicted amidophosphoribosyltransferase